VESETALFLDADDRILPESLSFLRGLLKQRPNAVAAVGRTILWQAEPASGTSTAGRVRGVPRVAASDIRRPALPRWTAAANDAA